MRNGCGVMNFDCLLKTTFVVREKRRCVYTEKDSRKNLIEKKNDNTYNIERPMERTKKMELELFFFRLLECDIVRKSRGFLCISPVHVRPQKPHTQLK